MESDDDFDNQRDSETDFEYKRTNQIKTGLKEMIRVDTSHKKDQVIISGNGILVLSIEKDNLTTVNFDKKRSEFLHAPGIGTLPQYV
jgi:hypothetical protein